MKNEKNIRSWKKCSFPFSYVFIRANTDPNTNDDLKTI